MSENDSPLDATALRERTRAICARFPDEYWTRLDEERTYPAAFVDALTADGLLAALIPAEYGGLGLGVREASVIMEEINRSGGHSAACHAQLYIMGALVRHGSETQKRRYLPDIAAGRLRLQSLSLTEAAAGSDTTRIETVAERDGDEWVVTGEKSWTSRMAETDLAIVVARTSPRGEARTRGLSLFLVDLREVRERQPDAIVVTPVRTMFNYATYSVRYRGLRLPADAVVGTVGEGFRHLVDGWNAERILLAAEAIGDGYWFIERAVEYARSTERFGRPIGANQGVQFPLAEAWMRIRAADLVRYSAADRFDRDDAGVGVEANTALYLASEASWAAANAALDTHGGFGFVDRYSIERKFRETRLYQVAPVSTNLIRAHIAQHELGLPRSY